LQYFSNNDVVNAVQMVNWLHGAVDNPHRRTSCYAASSTFHPTRTAELRPETATSSRRVGHENQQNDLWAVPVVQARKS